MSKLHKRILELVKNKEVKISSHGYDEMVEDNIFVKDIMGTINESVVIKEYPEYLKGPCLLVLQYDLKDNPIHVVWGIPKKADSPAVLVTAYRPDPEYWTSDFKRKKK